MAKWKLEEMLFITICQKCDSLPVSTPLANLEYPKGVIFTPDIVYCAECGAQLTVQVRSMSKTEIEIRDKEAAEKSAKKKKWETLAEYTERVETSPEIMDGVDKVNSECPVDKDS